MSPSELLLILLRSAFGWMFLGVGIGLIFNIRNAKITWFVKWACVRTTLPLLVFTRVALYFEPARSLDMVAIVISALGFLALSYGGSLILTRTFAITQDHPTFHLGNSFHNYGFLSYGLVANLLGEASMPQLFIFVITLEALLWTWGVKLVRNQEKTNWKNFISPPAIGMALGLMYKGLGVFEMETTVLWPALLFLGDISTPMALTGLGVLLYNISRQLHWQDFKSLDLAASLIYRHFMFPALVVSILLFTLPFGELRGILLIQAIMPMALMPINIVAIYGGDKKALGLAICSSMLLCIITIPCWLIFLKQDILQ